jgi:predicted RND superfamily exporter protein
MSPKNTGFIDQFSVALCTWVIRRRWWVIALSIVITALIASNARFLNFATDYRVFFSGQNPDLVAFEKFQQTYTKNDNLLIVIRAEDGRSIDNEIAGLLERITEEAWQIPFATRVDSITNFQHTIASEDELVVADLIKDGLSMNPSLLAQAVNNALQEPLLNNFLISPESDTTAVNVTLQYPGKALSEGPESVAYARQMLLSLQADYPQIKMVLTGTAMLNMAFTEASIKDMSSLTPLMYGVLMLITFFMLRSVTATLATFILIVFSSLITLGAGGLMQVLMTPISLSAPTIVLTLAIADSIHILVTMRELMAKGVTKNQALVESVRINFTAVMVTSITTIIGFMALNFSDSPPFHHLGNMTAFGIAAAWLLSITLLPALISILPVKVALLSKQTQGPQFFDYLADFVFARPKKILISFALLITLFSTLAFTNQLNDVWTKYFDESIQFRTDTDFAIKHLGAFYPVEFSISAKAAEGISDPEYLQTLDEFVLWLRSQPYVEHVYSLSDIMKRLNKNMHADDEAYYRLPEERELSAQYLLLYELSLPYGLDMNDRVSIDKSSSRVTATLGDVDTVQTREFIADSRQWLEQNAPEYMWGKATGATQMFSYIAKRNIESMLTGNVVAVTLIALVLIIILRSFRLGMLSIIPNATPVLVTLGIWALAVGQVGLPVAIVTVTSLGIVVDDTVHLLTKYLRGRREKNLSAEESIRYALKTVGKAITMNTIIIAIGFSVLALSSFKINQETGMLTALVVVVALVLDFLMLPAILCVLDKKTKQHSTA